MSLRPELRSADIALSAATLEGFGTARFPETWSRARFYQEEFRKVLAPLTDPPSRGPQQVLPARCKASTRLSVQSLEVLDASKTAAVTGCGSIIGGSQMW